MTPPPLVPLRQTLHRAGAAPPPWCPRDQLLQSLLTALRDHREDEALWAQLSQLAEDLGVLRDHLDGPDDVGRWSGGLRSVRAFAGFVFLAAAACSGSSEPTGTEPRPYVQPEYCAEAVGQGFEGGNAVVYCQLIELIDGAIIDIVYKNTLKACLVGQLTPTERDRWLVAFRDASDEELAQLLFERATTEPCYYEDIGTH